MEIELRSDTFTKPTPAMREAMMAAEVGDDVWGEDPTVAALEQKTATLLSKEAALFCPSGTQTNQIAIRIHTQPQQEVICDRLSHIYNHEGGGMASNSGVSVRLLHGDKGRFTASMVAENINPEDEYFAQTALVSLENTVNKGGGAIYDTEEIIKIAALCQTHNLRMHLDGARLFNALAETNTAASDIAMHFDTISLCLSKGLGAPIGSLLVGSADHIKKARRVRKVFGGGMRQSGFLAAAGIYALDHHIDRLTHDHTRARALGQALEQNPAIKEVLPVATNIVICVLAHTTSDKAVAWFAAQGLRCAEFGTTHVRMVTHLDFTDDMLEKSIAIIKKFGA